MIRVLYGQAQVLPASLFDLGISPYINSSIFLTILMVLPNQLMPFQWLTQLKEARKEGKTVSATLQRRAPCPCPAGVRARWWCQ